MQILANSEDKFHDTLYNSLTYQWNNTQRQLLILSLLQALNETEFKALYNSLSVIAINKGWNLSLPG
jgi:hypothetical protein